LAGIGVVATLAGAIATYFLGQGNDLASLSDQLTRIERKLDALSDAPHTSPAEGGQRAPGSHL
ncbi:MAG: hypothetical protein ACRDFT_02720, partial [bacterium]